MLGGTTVTLLYQVVLTAATLLVLAVGSVAWRNRPNTGAFYLALTSFGVAVWIAPSLLQSLTSSLALDELFSRLAYVGITVTMPSWFLLAAEYTDRDRFTTRPVRAVIWSVSAATLLIVWTGMVVDHGLLYSDVSPAPGTVTGVDVSHGAGFYGWVVFGYLLSFGSLAMFVTWFHRSTDLYRRQAAMVLVAAVGPLVANALYVTEVVAVDATPLGFAVGSAALAFGVFEFGLTAVTPVARESLMTNIRDGVLVTDDEGRITDANPAARRLLGFDGSAIGSEVAAVLDGPVADIAAEAGAAETQTLVTLDGATGTRHVDVRVWPQSDDRGRSLGHLFYLRDVTERQQRERELERQNDRLDRFASLLSHDLRNPLSVAEGYVELAQESGDVAHLDDVVEAHERMEELIEDVLTMAREGEAVDDPEPVDLGAVTRAAWETVDTGSAALDVRTEATVLGDRVRVRRLFENLFRNAVEHGSPSADAQAREDDGLTVTVGDVAGAEGGFYVADDGVGISPGNRDDVLEDGFTTGADGTGLGLSVVQSIADAHGWSVGVAESEAGGARFEFLGTVAPEATAAVPHGR